MSEDDWARSTDPDQMLAFLRTSGKLSERKARLFAVACCRRIWHLLTDERSRQAVRVAERNADDLTTAEELDTASDAACAVWDTDRERASTGGGMLDELGHALPYSAAAYNAAIPLGWWGAAPAFVAPYTIILEATPDREGEGTGQCVILRDIFGNPFRPPPPLAPSLRGTLVQLARAAYEERELPSGHLSRERLGVLGDALEEAGGPAELVAHLRGPGPHLRGCHVVDLILGRS